MPWICGFLVYPLSLSRHVGLSIRKAGCTHAMSHACGIRVSYLPRAYVEETLPIRCTSSSLLAATRGDACNDRYAVPWKMNRWPKPQKAHLFLGGDSVEGNKGKKGHIRRGLQDEMMLEAQQAHLFYPGSISTSGRELHNCTHQKLRRYLRSLIEPPDLCWWQQRQSQ